MNKKPLINRVVFNVCFNHENFMLCQLFFSLKAKDQLANSSISSNAKTNSILPPLLLTDLSKSGNID